MESVSKLIKQYQTELSDDYTMIRIRARLIHTELDNQILRYQQKIKALQQMNKKRSKILDTIANMSLVNYDAEKIMRTFTWSALLLSVTFIFSILSKYFFGFFIGLIFSGFVVGICAYTVLPLVAHHYISQSKAGKYAWNELLLRHALLVFAAIEGLLVGYVLSEREIPSLPPLAALTPCVIGIGTPFLKPMISNNRPALLVATICGSFALHMLIGMLVGLSFAYILLAAIYTAIGLVTLQLFIANVDENTVFTHNYQFAILYATLLSEFLVYQILGGKPEDMRD